MDAAEALSAWADFPIHAATRPLIVVGPLLHESGYTSSEAKIAFYERRLEITGGVPEAAARSLTAEIGTITSGPDHTLSMLGAVRTRRAFPTDRGPHELDAWSVEISETLGPVIVVDVDERARMWPVPDGLYGGGSARRLDRTDTRFRLSFTGSPWRYTDYEGADVTTGDTAVAISPRATANRGDGIRLAYAERREVEFSLAAPLGHRVLIRPGGSPIEVLDE